jgi:hypothetical protein
MIRRPAIGGSLLAALTVMLLAGCAPADGPGHTAGFSPSPSPSSSPTPTSAPSPTPTPDAAPAPTCDTVLTDDGYQKLADDGLATTTVGVGYPLVERMTEAGAVACAWGKPQTDIALTVAQVPLDAEEEEGWRSTLAELGYVESGQPVAGSFTGPVDPGSGISSVAVLAGGTLTFVSAPTFATMLAPPA